MLIKTLSKTKPSLAAKLNPAHPLARRLVGSSTRVQGVSCTMRVVTTVAAVSQECLSGCLDDSAMQSNSMGTTIGSAWVIASIWGRTT
jgi:hypothetical protein